MRDSLQNGFGVFIMTEVAHLQPLITNNYELRDFGLPRYEKVWL